MKRTGRYRQRGSKALAVEGDVAEFDREFVVDSFSAPSAQARQRWHRAKGKLGRPRVGKGAQVISVSMERGLLDLSDQLADKLGVTRASLIARGLRAILAAEGVAVPSATATR